MVRELQDMNLYSHATSDDVLLAGAEPCVDGSVMVMNSSSVEF